MSVCGRLDLIIDLKRKNETLKFENFEDDEYPVLKSTYEQRAHAHYIVIGHNAPQNSIPEFLTAEIPTQKKLLPAIHSTAKFGNTHFTGQNIANG